MLVINNLSFSYDKELVIDNFSLTVNSEEIIAIIGKSGCGKTTLLNNCANIHGNNKAIVLNNEVLDAQKKKIGLLMQDYGLLPWLNVRNNCLLPYKIKKEPLTDALYDEFNRILTKLEISALVDQKVNHLSGGEKQRVALARLFTFKPDLILLDEAFSNLDIFIKEEAINLFFSLWQANPVPTILVTHNIDEALFMASKIVVVTTGCQVLETIPNPLFMDNNYRLSKQYGTLYNKIATLIKGDN
ncbi:ATP-binding cassette domain-containing protein [Erysipelotrichaceae bacterium OttesenSCG-928-M19]|nr:ATP-binding cassette domain-containing protein [Erysipelotrichaceae bacterium OttesenSCG-928-M19]